ncbi:GntR family transcriptional regulator [Hydrogenophaga sp.]|uniref:GntR family transcriptional regulator n=1 Tax=Hydrogenophaga sp. TaxID=1904254 RepID=UPI0025B83CB3|nr:GntR family transcriptional regulator [Hydrogenophaga sp.]MBT9463306.1 FCD domain-containing protein [Hydrogenophaga sp.]
MSTTPPTTALAQISQRRSRTLTSIVREEIGNLIAAGELKGGDRINESDLAARLGVSRGPVREACRSLEEAGLLVGAVNQGVFVREMTLDDARQLYEVRGALSGLMGRLAAERIGDKDVKALNAQLKAMESAAMSGDVAAYYPLNLRFHECLMQIANNKPLEVMYLSIVNQTHLFRRRGLIQSGSLKVSNEEHRDIVDALARRDADAAERLLANHVKQGWQRLVQSGESTG